MGFMTGFFTLFEMSLGEACQRYITCLYSEKVENYASPEKLGEKSDETF